VAFDGLSFLSVKRFFPLAEDTGEKYDACPFEFGKALPPVNSIPGDRTHKSVLPAGFMKFDNWSITQSYG
jgi:hypothetical protein